MTLKDCPNGAILFCSAVLSEHWLPPTPLKGTKFWCDRRFDTAELQKALEALRTEAYGIIVIDGADALFGEVQGLQASQPARKLMHLRPPRPIPSETRRGGQSAARYERLREEARLDFLRRVASKASLFSGAPGLILAGKADMKRRLLEELPRPLRGRVLSIIDLPCSAGHDNALRLAADRARHSMDAEGHRQVDQAVSQFLELTRSDAASCCYGEAQTLIALKMGAVERLLVDANWESDGHSLAELKALAEAKGTELVEVQPRGAEAVGFCRGFGIAGCLRWPVDLDLLEEPTSSPKATEIAAAMPGLRLSLPAAERLTLGGMMPASDEPCRAGCVERWEPAADSPAGPMAVPELVVVADQGECSLMTEVLSWLQGELVAALGDPSAAEALAASADVILSGEAAAQEQEEDGEVMAQTLEMLRGEGAPEAVVVEFASRWARMVRPSP